ncbi:MAG TPA: SRPBCC family protein [Stellaceae bacterium]|nr:SRPBCC family protein [Stellaceae bacterium]
MYTLSVAVDVNPDGASPRLTQEQVWRGLVMKAENAVLFVPRMQSCDVLERYDSGLLREVVNDGHRFREKIAFTPPVEVLFERVDTADNAGWITNVISESEHGLLLTFTFAVNLPGVAPGSAEERAKGETMRESYVGAVKATLARVRQLIGEGKL